MTDSRATTEPLQRIIERAVRDVLAARLREPDRPAAATATPADPDRATRWRVERSPVTLADLENAPLKQLKQLMVPARAVITPAVRDVLRGHNIELQFAAPTGAGNGLATEPSRLALALIVDADGRGRDAAIQALLARRGLELDIASDCASLFAASGGRRAVVVADVPQPIVAQVFTTGRRVAAQVADLAAVDAAASQMQPDVWVLDGRHASLHQVAALAERCLRMGGR